MQAKPVVLQKAGCCSSDCKSSSVELTTFENLETAGAIGGISELPSRRTSRLPARLRLSEFKRSTLIGLTQEVEFQGHFLLCGAPFQGS